MHVVRAQKHVMRLQLKRHVMRLQLKLKRDLLDL
jgi:hypothetical protein